MEEESEQKTHKTHRFQLAYKKVASHDFLSSYPDSQLALTTTLKFQPKSQFIPFSFRKVELWPWHSDLLTGDNTDQKVPIKKGRKVHLTTTFGHTGSHRAKEDKAISGTISKK